jgi:hypothetical protein
VKNKRINIIILALFQLMVFVVPLSIKSEHRHIQGNSNALVSSLHGKVVSKAEQSCPICKFEFVHFLTPPTNQFPVLRLAKPLKNSELVSAEYNYPFTSFSHRAPPVS